MNMPIEAEYQAELVRVKKEMSDVLLDFGERIDEKKLDRNLACSYAVGFLVGAAVGVVSKSNNPPSKEEFLTLCGLIYDNAQAVGETRQ
jgi:hypothetical protein